MLTFDLETTNFSKGSALDQRNRVVAVCWKENDGPVARAYLSDSGWLTAADFWEAYDRHDVICCYNKKFEQLWLLRHRIDIDKKIWHDPMLAEKVLQGNRRVPFDLGSVAKRYGFDAKDPVIDTMMKAGICPSEMPPKRLVARCARDVRTTYEIMQRQKTLLTEQANLHLYRVRCDFGNVLAHIEAEGMLLDRERVHAEYIETSRSLAKVQAKLDELTGGINLRSPDQLAHYLYGKLGFPERGDRHGKPLRNKPSKQFPDGRPKTDQATLTWLSTKATTEDQREFVRLRTEYGKLNAALVKNLEFFEGVCRERASEFHAQFNQTVAGTHRLTSSGIPLEFQLFDNKPKSVQLQNMPRAYKGLFKAPDGYYIAEVDASQLEFRVAAFLGQDKVAIADISDPDFDAHCRSASVMNRIDYREFLSKYRAGTKKFKTLRTAAKVDTFKPLYGGTRGTEDQERWYKEFQTRYAGIYSTQEGWLAEVAQTGELRLPWGMRFSWSTRYNKRGVLLDTASGKPVGPQVFNYPVQSLATAEIVPISIISLYKACKSAELGVRFINTVHDSVICLVPKHQIDQFCRLAETAFTVSTYEYLSLHYGLDFNVPLGCEITYGDHWGEGTEIKYDDVINRRAAA